MHTYLCLPNSLFHVVSSLCSLIVFSTFVLSVFCVTVWPITSYSTLTCRILGIKSLIFLSQPASVPSYACHCSTLCSTLACFVNNHLFVAGKVEAITSDLPVSSIMDRLLDVNICRSSLLNSPPGWD